jgi:hypothetical protein
MAGVCVVDPYKRLRRQAARHIRREHFRQLYEDQLLDIAYRGYTEEQRQTDLWMRTQVDWLNKP